MSIRTRVLSLLSTLILVCGCDEQLVHDLNESEANRLITRLESAQIGSSKDKQADGKWTVVVAHDQYLSALKFLDQARLLKSTANVAEYQSSMIASRDEQRFQFERALSSEIEATLMSAKGVLEARVHLNLPQVDPLLGRRLESNSGSASVLLVSAERFELSNEEIAQLVSGAAGINVASVSVLVSKETSSQTQLADARLNERSGTTSHLSKIAFLGGALGSTLMLVGSYAVVRSFRNRR